jgi:hypothetical protein
LQGDDDRKQLILVTADESMKRKARRDGLKYVVHWKALAAWCEHSESIPDTVAKLQEWFQKVGSEP